MATAPLTPEPHGSPLLELDDIPPEDDQAVVAAKIRELMGRYRVSQQRLATAVGISRVGLSDRLAGKTNFTLRELGRVARAFGLSIRDLFPPLMASGLAALYVTRTTHPPDSLREFYDQLTLFPGETPDAGESVEVRPAIAHKEAA